MYFFLNNWQSQELQFTVVTELNLKDLDVVWEKKTWMLYEKKKELNGLIVEQIICLQIKTYLVAKSYGQGGERMRR